MKIDEDDGFNRNDKKFVKIKMISSIKIYKLIKSVSLVKSIIYKVNKVSSIVIRCTSTFFFYEKHTKHTQIHTKNKAITIFFNYFCLLLLTFSYLDLLFFTPKKQTVLVA